MSHRLFQQLVRVPDYKYCNQSVSLNIPSHLLKKDKVAQYHKGHIRPLFFYPLTNDEFIYLLTLLKSSRGALARENYESFLPFMLPLEYIKNQGHGYVALDVKENRKVKVEFEKRNKRSKY